MFFDLRVGGLHDALRGQHWPTAECERRVTLRLIELHAAGMRHGDRVFMHFGNTPEFFIDLLAIWQLGACAIPVDARFSAFEIETLARAARPRFSLWDQAPAAALASQLEGLGVRSLVGGAAYAATASADPAETPVVALPQLDDDALMLFTSGTTGAPKCVVHTHRTLLARWMGLRQALGQASFQRTLCMLPTHFGHGLICNCLYPWLSGCDLYIAPAFRPDLIAQLGSLLDQHRITFFSSVPAIWRLALKTARPPTQRSLARVFVGSAPLSAALWQGVKDWTGAAEVANAYGITETGSWLAGTVGLDSAPSDGLVGAAWGGVIQVTAVAGTEDAPLPGAVCAAGESGKVWVHTPALMKGYLDRPDLTRRAVAGGWLLTGDIGFKDERGWLYLRGREREEINVGGMKVYPADVDAVIERAEGVADSCTFAYDDALLGENIGIAVVLREGAALPSVLRWAQAHLAKHQLPKRWYTMGDLPRTSRGKLNRSDIAKLCAALPATELRQLEQSAAPTISR